MLNRVSLIGRLVADPELKQTNGGVSVVNFVLAIDRDYKNSETGDNITDFVSCTAWRQDAEFLCRFFKSGSRVAVDGRIESSRRTDENGNERRYTSINAEHVYSVDRPAYASPAESAPAEEAE